MKAINCQVLNFFRFCYFASLINVSSCARLERGIPVVGKFHGSGAHVNKEMGLLIEKCNTLQPESLAEIMGPAYNPRYMSVIPPPEDLQNIDTASKDSVNKRKTSAYHQFFVDGDYAQELDDKPAWEINHFRSADLSRLSNIADSGKVKRAAPPPRPWECQAIVKWIDLGEDYFPRYLRTVECTKHDCWYGQYTCKARSFTVKLLRRKRGKCVYHGKKEGTVGLPRELRELWVWEERAVNFCCDCAHF